MSGTAVNGPLSIDVAEGWTASTGVDSISLSHRDEASLSLLCVQDVPRVDYIGLVDNRERLRDLVAKNGNPSVNKVSGFGLELYEFRSPAGEGYAMIVHPPDTVIETRRSIDGNLFVDGIILVTGKYMKDDATARREIEAMLDTVEFRAKE
jgi:hypothetical protein